MGTSPDRLALVDELRRVERHAVVSRLSRVFAHLIGTPLNVIGARASLIRKSAESAAVIDNAQRIEAQVERLAQQTQRLIDSFRYDDSTHRLRSVADVVADALALYEPVAAGYRVEIALKRPDLPDALLLEDLSTLVVLTNLLSLSIRTAPAGTRIELGVSAVARQGVVFELSVPGFLPPAARVDRMDAPAASDPAAAEPLQVLTICHAIAEQHGARLELHAGTEKQIRLRCPAR